MAIKPPMLFGDVHSKRKVEVQYCDKRLSFPGLVISYFSVISIDFHPKEAIKFTAATTVF